MKTTNPQFELKGTTNSEFHFILKARNGRTILSSETYQSIFGAQNGIESVKENANGDNPEEHFDVLKSSDGLFYFNMLANNNQVIGTSETYTTKRNCLKGIQSVITNAKLLG